MDFTDYGKHMKADNKLPKDKFRDCARQASENLVKIFKTLFDKAIVNKEVIDLAFTKAKVIALKDLLITKVWGISDGREQYPAGGTTADQGTVEIQLANDALVTEAELENYIQVQIRDQAEKKPFKKMKDEQKGFLSQFKYAARSDNRRLDADAGKYYFQFNQALDDEAFTSCTDIMPDLENAPAINDFEIIYQIPDEIEAEESISEEQLEANGANQIGVKQLFFLDEFGLPVVPDDDQEENNEDELVVSDQVPLFQQV